MFNDATLAVYAGLLIWAALSDALALRIPNRVPIALLILYPCYLLSAGEIDLAMAYDGLIALGIAALIFVIGFFFFARGWMGGGDVKLLSLGALWAGPHLLPDFLVVTALLGGVQALASVLKLGALLPHWAALALANSPSQAPANRSPAQGNEAAGEPAARKRSLPYGIAIAGGGLYVACRLAGIIAT